MRSNLITVVTVAASALLVAHVAAADPVQEQLRLMEQRMAEMEDRLQATSDQLETAKDTVTEQQDLLTEAGIIEEDEGGLRSAVGGFVDMVDVSGVVAASFNYRIIESDIDTDGGSGIAGGNALFRHPDANTFSIDQVWLTLDKPATEESRGGFHVEFVTGQAGRAQGSSGGADSGVNEPHLYSAYASYLAPIGNGIQVDLGRLATPLGAEVVQANGNYFVTQGLVFGLQPVAHTGVSFSTDITDGIGFTFGVVNEVYSDVITSTDNDKAYYGQFQFSGDKFGLNVGGIIGDDSSGALAGCFGADCRASVVDVVLTADPTENVSLWANFDWAHGGGDDTVTHGDAFGVSVAGRLGITDSMGIASRFEFVHTEDSLAGATDDVEQISLTTTLDKRLTDDLVSRLELRWDRSLDDDVLAFAGGEEDQLVAIWEMFFEF